MIREAVLKAIREGKNTSTFKYNGEEWKVIFYGDYISLEVDANGSWTSLADINAEVKNIKGAIKIAKKEIDSFNKNY